MLCDRLAQAAIDRRRLKNNRPSKIGRELTERNEEFSIRVVKRWFFVEVARRGMFIVGET